MLLVLFLLVLVGSGTHRFYATTTSTRPAPVRNPGWFGNPAEAGRAEAWQELVDGLHKQMAAARPRLVFIGDSLTENWLYRGREIWDRHYAPRGALNLGIGGDRTEHALWRLKSSPLEAMDPEVVVVQIGINNLFVDSPAEAARGVLAVVDHVAERLPRAQLVVIGLFPAGQLPGPHRDAIRETNARIRASVAGRSLRYLEFGDRFLRPDGVIPKGMMWDYLHLTEAAYAIWAEELEPVLEERLGRLPGPPAGDHDNAAGGNE